MVYNAAVCLLKLTFRQNFQWSSRRWYFSLSTTHSPMRLGSSRLTTIIRTVLAGVVLKWLNGCGTYAVACATSESEWNEKHLTSSEIAFKSCHCETTDSKVLHGIMKNCYIEVNKFVQFVRKYAQFLLQGLQQSYLILFATWYEYDMAKIGLHCIANVSYWVFMKTESWVFIDLRLLMFCICQSIRFRCA